MFLVSATKINLFEQIVICSNKFLICLNKLLICWNKLAICFNKLYPIENPASATGHLQSNIICTSGLHSFVFSHLEQSASWTNLQLRFLETTNFQTSSDLLLQPVLQPATTRACMRFNTYCFNCICWHMWHDKSCVLLLLLLLLLLLFFFFTLGSIDPEG